jgi:F-type H+-transporting ATPase subunit b
MRRFGATLLLAATLTVPAASAFARAQEKPEGAAPEKKEPGEGMELWKWANFAVLAGGLGWMIGKNAGPFFAARSQKIRQEMSEAEEVRREAEERAADVSRRLANLDSEITALRQQSKAEADAEAGRVAAHTAAEIGKIRTHAETEIVSAGKAARTELKRYSAELAVNLAEQKVKARMNPEAQEALVKGFLHDLANSTAGAQSN